jgi:hypothetical protein
VVEKRQAALAVILPTIPPGAAEAGSIRRHDAHWVGTSAQVRRGGRHSTAPDGTTWYGLITRRSRVQIPSPRRKKPLVRHHVGVFGERGVGGTFYLKGSETIVSIP